MKIITLIEDTRGHESCAYEHGLSIYIETQKHKLLMDAGAGNQFISNAELLGIDIASADMLILSHGHYDHAGGILDFARINPGAPIYMQKEAAGNYYHKERYIGIDKAILNLPQVQMLEGDKKIDDELYIFSDIRGRRYWAKSNYELKEKAGSEYVQDEFRHEQCLVITQGDKHILLSGCAHNGILNILDRYREIFGGWPQSVISGFHMNKKSEYTKEEAEVIIQTARELKELDTVFYTGHCTGQAAYEMMKPVMGDKLQQLHTGIAVI